MKVLLIYRAPEYSPNNVGNDTAILDAVGQTLAEQIATESLQQADVGPKEQVASLELVTCTENSLPIELESYDLILHMARRLATLMRLEQVKHPVVINAPHGVRNVAKSRELTLMLLDSTGIPVPEWWAYDPEEDEMFMYAPHLQRLLPAWVKAMRTDGAKAADVSYVSSPLEADTRILELTAQRIPDIVVTRHVEGDLIKCYYVATSASSEAENCSSMISGSFLHWFYPQESGYSKFGNAEQHNSPLTRIAVSTEQLKALAARIANVLGLEVFGFDAIVQPSMLGMQPKVIIIDVNDWPTFGCCRAEAAQAIVRLALSNL